MLMGQESGTISLVTTGNYFKASLPAATKMGSFGEAFLSYGFLAYLAIIIAVICAFILKKTRTGLNLRAIGESPQAADAAGINVTKYKYIATITGSAIAGLGGLYFVMDYTGGAWTNGGFGDRGWLAIALVIFAIWNPKLAMVGSILFGGLFILPVQFSGLSSAATELIKMLPYIVTILVLIITSLTKRKETQPPESLGLSYFREER